jgi:hypothetical protein
MSPTERPWIATLEATLIVPHGGPNEEYDALPSAGRLALKNRMLHGHARMMGSTFRAPLRVPIQVDEGYALVRPDPRSRKPAAVQIVEAALAPINRRRTRAGNPPLVVYPPVTGACRKVPGAHHDRLLMKLGLGRRPIVLREGPLVSEIGVELSYTFPM